MRKSLLPALLILASCSTAAEKRVDIVLRNDSLVTPMVSVEASVWIPPSADAARAARLLESSGTSVSVSESTPEGVRLTIAGAPGIDMRMLNVVRDPRAVAWSWRRQIERPHATSGTDQMWRIPAHRSAAQWSTLQLEMAAIAVPRPTARMKLRRTASCGNRAFITVASMNCCE